LKKIPTLRPAFDDKGTITAANALTITDAAPPRCCERKASWRE
jgi:acetyl-CoA acetyltransferase